MLPGYNRPMRIFGRHRWVDLIFGLVVLALTACSSQMDEASASSTATIVLVPYQTATMADLLSPGDSVGLPLPTSTPYLYTVIPGDTFFTIAARLEISLDALLAANPNVDARLLTPGTELLIPTSGDLPAEILPTPTPLPAELNPVVCYATAANELWCFLLVVNDGDRAMENLSGLVQLISADGEVIANVAAVAPLNVLPVGQAMPLVAFLKDPPAEWLSVRGQLLGAYALAQGDENYLDAELRETDINISETGLTAQVMGEIDITSGGQASLIWVLAVAYDANGEVAGIRRWESENESAFYLTVYSLGPRIAEVQLLIEARP